MGHVMLVSKFLAGVLVDRSWHCGRFRTNEGLLDRLATFGILDTYHVPM